MALPKAGLRRLPSVLLVALILVLAPKRHEGRELTADHRYSSEEGAFGYDFTIAPGYGYSVFTSSEQSGLISALVSSAGSGLGDSSEIHLDSGSEELSERSASSSGSSTGFDDSSSSSSGEPC